MALSKVEGLVKSRLLYLGKTNLLILDNSLKVNRLIWGNWFSVKQVIHKYVYL